MWRHPEKGNQWMDPIADWLQPGRQSELQGPLLHALNTPNWLMRLVWSAPCYHRHPCPWPINMKKVMCKLIKNTNHKSIVGNCVLVFFAQVACTFLKIIKIYCQKMTKNIPGCGQEGLLGNPSGARKLFWATLLEPGSSSLRWLWCQEAAPWHQRVPGGWFLSAITSLLGTLLSAKTLPHGIHTTERKDFPSR